MEAPKSMTNRVIVTGRLAESRRGDRALPSVPRRSANGGPVLAFRLITVSAFGEPIQLDLEASSLTPGIDLLTREQLDQPIAIEGVIRRQTRRDPRYATADQDLGARVGETSLQVTTIRLPHMDEPVAGSAVWLEGSITPPPRFGLHRTLPGMLLARTLLRVDLARPSDYPGSRAVLRESMEIPVTIPVTDTGAACLYRPGNVVRIEGQLDLTRIPQGLPAAQERLEQIDAAWEAERSQRAADQQTLPSALRRYRSQRAQLLETPLLTVVCGAVDLLSGSALEASEAEELLREATRRRRRRVGEVQERVNTPDEMPAVQALAAPDGDLSPVRRRRRVQGDTPEAGESNALPTVDAARDMIEN